MRQGYSIPQPSVRTLVYAMSRNGYSNSHAPGRSRRLLRLSHRRCPDLRLPRHVRGPSPPVSSAEVPSRVAESRCRTGI